MFCGDDTGAVIGEIAGCHSRFGNSGEDLPKYQVPSNVVVAGGRRMSERLASVCMDRKEKL